MPQIIQDAQPVLDAALIAGQPAPRIEELPLSETHLFTAGLFERGISGHAEADFLSLDPVREAASGEGLGAGPVG